MSESKVCDNDVSSFLKDVIELGDVYMVDSTPDKFIRWKKSGEPIKLTVDGTQKPLGIYGTRASDVIVINPFVEGENETTKNIWFYTTRNVVLAGNVVKLIQYLLNKAANAKKTSKKPVKTKDGKEEIIEEETPIDVAAIKYLGDNAVDIDDKMIKEFELVSKELSKFFLIHYNKTEKKAEVKCMLFIPAQQKAYSTVRAKTWEVLKNILFNILGMNEIQNLSEFDYAPKIIGIPQLESFVHILVTVFDRLSIPMQMMDKNCYPQLPSLKSHLNYLDGYYNKAKWCSNLAQMASVNQQNGLTNVTQVQTQNQVSTMPAPLSQPQIPNNVTYPGALPPTLAVPVPPMQQIPVYGQQPMMMQQQAVPMYGQQIMQPMSVQPMFGQSYYNQQPQIISPAAPVINPSMLGQQQQMYNPMIPTQQMNGMLPGCGLPNVIQQPIQNQFGQIQAMQQVIPNIPVLQPTAQNPNPTGNPFHKSK